MKILVVSNLFSAVRRAITTDGDQAKGMPGFLKAMQYFSNSGIHIDYIFFSTIQDDLKILNSNSKVSFIPSNSIKKMVLRHIRFDRYTKNVFFAHRLKKSVRQVLMEEHYDFIYLMTPLSVSINKLANRMGIPCGMRLFGSFLWSHLNDNGILKTRFFCGDEIQAYNTPKKFLLTTNDGSHGIDSYNMFCKDKSLYDYYYWINGVDRLVINNERKDNIQKMTSDNDILYIATITGWKRQDRAIETIKHLKDMNIPCRLCLIGDCPPESAQWREKLEKMIQDYQLEKDVVFFGSMAREDFLYLAMKSRACLLLQDTTNMGNVFHELFSVGSIIISLNDGSLDGFIEHGNNGFLVNDTYEAAEIIGDLINGKIDTKNIRENAIKTSEKLLLSWDERFERELELIKNAIK